MKSRDFCFWLQGFFELSDDQAISATKAKMIQDHLALVFAHEIDPSMGDATEQGKLNFIHHSTAPIEGSSSSGPIMRC